MVRLGDGFESRRWFLSKPVDGRGGFTVLTLYLQNSTAAALFEMLTDGLVVSIEGGEAL